MTRLEGRCRMLLFGYPVSYREDRGGLDASQWFHSACIPGKRFEAAEFSQFAGRSGWARR